MVIRMKWDKEAHSAENQRLRVIQAEKNRKQELLNEERGIEAAIQGLISHKELQGISRDDIERLRLKYITRDALDKPSASIYEYIKQEVEKESNRTEVKQNDKQ